MEEEEEEQWVEVSVLCLEVLGVGGEVGWKWWGEALGGRTVGYPVHSGL